MSQHDLTSEIVESSEWHLVENCFEDDVKS